MIVLNLVIGVIMNSMDESNEEMSLRKEIERASEATRPDSRWHRRSSEANEGTYG